MLETEEPEWLRLLYLLSCPKPPEETADAMRLSTYERKDTCRYDFRYGEIDR